MALSGKMPCVSQKELPTLQPRKARVVTFLIHTSPSGEEADIHSFIRPLRPLRVDPKSSTEGILRR